MWSSWEWFGKGDGERPKIKKGFRKERAGLGLVNLWSVVNLEGWGLLGQGIKTLWSKGITYCATFNCCSYLVLALVVMVLYGVDNGSSEISLRWHDWWWVSFQLHSQPLSIYSSATVLVVITIGPIGISVDFHYENFIPLQFCLRKA
jgi:hypothetical protein